MNSGPAGSGMYQKNEGVVVNEDALPAFPTWSNAPEARVYQHHHGHDSNDLGQQQQQQQQGGGVEMTNLYAHQTQGSDIPVSHPPPAATSYEPNPYAYNINNAGNGNRTGGVADGYHSISTQDLGTGGGGAGYEPYRGTSPAAGAGGARTGRGVGEYIARGGLNGGGSKNKSAWPQTQQQQRQVDQ
ncbi:MAG: hypothetical protein M1823_006002 [Watsoniomyces obsoletus]|nr:MAG: hypothetical protein M1823_006002 [Watsoniomyces obsoletus]